jgi:predicted polyphosphate/ATP-dependent NAD kinase
MGADVLLKAGIQSEAISVQPVSLPEQTEAEQTLNFVEWAKTQAIDLMVFAGGDGTARLLFDGLGTEIPVLGIPAGVKIHSGVYAVTPHAAGDVLAGLLNGDITELHVEEVRDIDEEAFRNGKVQARYYGEMRVPVSGEFMQHVKVGGIEDPSLVLNDIADWFAENIDPDVCYFIGSGKSTSVLMETLGLPNTLLGIDAVYRGQVVKTDCAEADILSLMKTHSCKFVLSIIGGQGHIFGRGNAQISPAVLRQLRKEDFMIIGTKAKLKTLGGRPLLVDTSDPKLDQAWAGLLEIVTGYNDHVVYPVAAR